jgi:hypothetical protein
MERATLGGSVSRYLVTCSLQMISTCTTSTPVHLDTMCSRQTASSPATTHLGPDFELILCGKCHDVMLHLLRLLAPRLRHLSRGQGPLHEHLHRCTCPAGYTADGARRSAKSAPAQRSPTPTSPQARPPTASRNAPQGFFANNSTWTCDACDPACTDCWGPAATDCRLCTAGAPTGLGTCTICAALTYPDAHEAFLCSPSPTSTT